MTNITLSVPDDIKKEMESFPEINWSEIARAAIKQRLLLLKKIKEFTKNSELTEKDAIEIGRKIKEGLAKRHSIK